MQNTQQRRIIVVATAIIVISVILSLYSAYTNRTVSVSSTPLRMPVFSGFSVTDENTIVYSNGNYFVSYDIHSGKTHVLSKGQQLPLPNISNVAMSTDKQSLVFQSLDQGKDDLLGAQLINQQIDTIGLSSFWWLYNAKTQTFTPIDARQPVSPTTNESPMYDLDPPRNIQAHLSSDGKSVFMLVSYPDKTKHIVKFSVNPYKKVADITIDNTVDSFYIVGDNFIILNKDKKIAVLDKNGKEIKVLKDKYSVIVGVEGGESENILAAQTTEESENVSFSVVNVQNESSYRIENTDLESVQALSNDGNLVGYKKDGKIIISERGFVTKKYTFDLPDSQIVSTETLSIKGVLSKDTVLALDQETGLYYLIGKDIKEFQYIPKNDYVVDRNLCPGCNLTYFSKEKYFIANILGDYSEEKKGIIYDTLLQNNINPDKVNVKFVFYILAPRN